ncbi:hypothetical protein HPC49_14910 [Pyxidicoccus fallax]|uniref:Glycosyltransferase family 9 protein n=1 Tax=Pyxidicoccus fallax TaxID=394095 RepID=A0A848LCV8_9BACT|nr:glycosyltransferase family 9 protein [Pyxidicoccus fallax]NMO14645.1 glycosyltransferase family 9 protein [Pyxidicoccus fallax]NPC79522.1 hypothetical protein [Pyxidicoccus fallax]
MSVPDVAMWLLRRRRALAARAPVVFHANAIGDRLLALPAVRALASLFPGRLTVVGPAMDERLYYAGLPLRAFHPFKMRWVGYSQFDPGALARQLEGCDLLVSFNSWHSEDVDALLAQLPGAVSIGFFRAFTKRFRRPETVNVCDAHFQAPRWLRRELRLEDFSQPPPLPEESLAAARQLRASLPPGARLLALHTEPSEDFKRWPAERFARVLEAFLERHPDFLVLVVDRAESGLEAIRHGDRVLSCAGSDLTLAMALVGTADLFLGIDSCMLHVADFFRVPAVGLFGQTRPSYWGCRFTTHRCLDANGPLETLGEPEVLDALEALVDAPRQSPPGPQVQTGVLGYR